MSATGLAGRRLERRRSPAMVRFFAAVFARDLAASFHAVRLLGSLPTIEGPLVVVANHPSWWDAAVAVWMASALFKDRRAFAPMEARMLARYPFFARIGAFGIDPGSVESRAGFVPTARRILAEADALLLVTAQGHLRDVRERPLRLLSGVAHVARVAPSATFLPLAIEYVFWDERRPNVLLHFGEPIPAGGIAALDRRDALARLSDGLRRAMDELSEAAMTRDPGRFRTLLSGRTRINAAYDLWRWLRARGGPELQPGAWRGRLTGR